MSSEDSKEVSGSVPSIISPDLKIVGDLKCTGDIQIDGTIEGSITGGLVIIGEQAKVEGSIVAETVRIFGTVNGRVRAKTVHLNKTGKVIGDIARGSGGFRRGGRQILGVGWSEYDRRRRVVAGSNCTKVRRATELPAMSGRGHQPGPTRSKSTEIPKLVALR